MWFHLLPDADCWQKISLDESFVRMSEWENNLSSVLELLCRESNISYSPDGVILNLLCRVAVMYIHLAQQTGFSCGFALSRAFRRYFKVSPGEYRKKF